MKLTLAALIAVLATGPAALAANQPSPGQIAIYARGWIDGAAPPGQYVTTVTCTRTYVCTARLNNGYCARATIKGYAFAGPWHRCKQQPPA